MYIGPTFSRTIVRRCAGTSPFHEWMTFADRSTAPVTVSAIVCVVLDLVALVEAAIVNRVQAKTNHSMVARRRASGIASVDPQAISETVCAHEVKVSETRSGIVFEDAVGNDVNKMTPRLKLVQSLAQQEHQIELTEQRRLYKIRSDWRVTRILRFEKTARCVDSSMHPYL